MKRSFGTHERGAGGIGAIIALIILAIAVYVAVTIIPIYAAYYDLKDKIEQDILFASQRFRGDLKQEITKQIISYLDGMKGVTYDKKNIRVEVHSPTKTISVQVWYTREHKIPGFPKQFNVDVQGKFAL
jgi:hypothetical protein